MEENIEKESENRRGSRTGKRKKNFRAFFFFFFFLGGGGGGGSVNLQISVQLTLRFTIECFSTNSKLVVE